MAKFYGNVGFAENTEIRPSVWKSVITDRPYYGDVITNTRYLRTNGNVNEDIEVSNQISIVADAYAEEHFFNMKYVEWMGARWRVTSVKVQRPRLILSLGGVYNGPES